MGIAGCTFKLFPIVVWPLEVCGSTSERQDSIITPISIASFAENFKGYFCARFDQDTPEVSYGIIQNGSTLFPAPQNATTEGPLLNAFAKFSTPDGPQQTIITLRAGTSFFQKTKRGVISMPKYQLQHHLYHHHHLLQPNNLISYQVHSKIQLTVYANLGRIF